MATQALTNFKFEDYSIRVFGDFIKPLFVAADVCKVLNIQNITQALQSLSYFEKTTVKVIQKNPRSDDPMLNIGSIEKTVNAVTESGLYTLILRCRDAIKEGTFAYRFRVWVTNEMLPSIRRTGSYHCPAIDQLTTLTPQQAREIQVAVAEKARITPSHYKAIYSALKRHFQVARYDQIPSSKFNEALDFIASFEPYIPTTMASAAANNFIVQSQSLQISTGYKLLSRVPNIEALPAERRLSITESDLAAMKTLIYYFDDLFKPQIQWAAREAIRQNRPDHSRFYDVWHESSLFIGTLRSIVQRYE